jgi:two-component system OmpR family sensor kinase
VRAGRGLRARLAARAALLSALSLAAVAVVVEVALVRPLAAGLDEDLERRVDALAAVVAEGGSAGFLRQAPAWIRPGRAEFCALCAGDGTLLGTAGRAPPPGAERVPPGGPATLFDPVSGDYRVLARTVTGPGARPLSVVGGISADEVRRRQGDIRLVVLAAALGGVLLVGAGAWFGADLVLHPLRGLTEGARNVDARREGMRIPVEPTGDEFEDLARLLNDLLARVEGALEEERRFAGEAAHELRAPLSVLRLRAEEALASARVPEMRRALEGTLADVERIDRLVQALLEMSRATVPPGAAAGAVDAGATLGAMAEDFRTLAGARGIRFEFRPPPGPARAAAPREVLETAVSVLVDNALRYTPSGGSVVLEVDAADGRVRARVRDSGPGVPADEAERVFDRLYRGKAGRASGAGFGLGLALARRLARSAGGDLLLENPGVPGAAFALVLPAA